MAPVSVPRAQVCRIAPRGLSRSERMTPAPGPAVACRIRRTRPQGAAVTDPIQPWPVNRRGDQRHPILTLQELLRAHGRNVAVDGVFGPATEAAVRAVQTSR